VWAFGYFVKDQMAVVWFVLGVLSYSVGLYASFVFMLLWLGVLFEVWYLCFFWLRITFAIRGLLCFHMSFRINFSTSAKNEVGILMDIALNM
jgi:hypothetical protein